MSHARRLKGDTDKPEAYLREYEKIFADLGFGDSVAVLELGVAKGGSLLMWRDYFPAGPVIGLDRNPAKIADESGRISTYTGDQGAPELLSVIARCHVGAFDLIVDDASHLGLYTKFAFWRLFTRHLRSGGLYAIEDWGAGYWEGHPLYTDGKHADPDIAERPVRFGQQFPSHLYGTGGFVKQLIDEVAMADLTHPEFGVPPQRAPRIREMRIFPGLVLVVKA